MPEVKDAIRRINERLNAIPLNDVTRELMRVQYANLHDSSCGGRVCLNPAHMPDEGAAIDVTTQSPTPEVTPDPHS
jgi:hypothetical protein